MAANSWQAASFRVDLYMAVAGVCDILVAKVFFARVVYQNPRGDTRF